MKIRQLWCKHKTRIRYFAQVGNGTLFLGHICVNCGHLKAGTKL